MKGFLIKTIPHCLWLAYGQNQIDQRLMMGMYNRMKFEAKHPALVAMQRRRSFKGG